MSNMKQVSRKHGYRRPAKLEHREARPRMADATCPFRCGDRVYDCADMRFVGEITAILSGHFAMIKWSNGWKSLVPARRLRLAEEGMA